MTTEEKSRIASSIAESEDVDFAEIFVMFQKYSQGNYDSLNRADMTQFDVDEFTDWLNEVLKDILFSQENCFHAWWKDNPHFDKCSDAQIIIEGE